MDSKSFSLTKCTSCLRFLSRRNAAAINLCASTLLSFFLYSGVSSSSVLIPVSNVNKSWCVSISTRSLRETFLSGSFGVKSDLLFFLRFYESGFSLNLRTVSWNFRSIGNIFFVVVVSCLHQAKNRFLIFSLAWSWLANCFVYPGSISCVSWRLMFHLRWWL